MMQNAPMRRDRSSGWVAGLLLVVLAAGPAVAQSNGLDQQFDQAQLQAELYAKALDLLLAASTDRNPLLRANAIEAMQPLPERALPMVQRGLADRNAGVRFVATATAGMLKLESLSPAVRPLLADKNPSVRAAARYTLHQLGERVDLTPLASVLMGRDVTARANAAMLLGLMGDESAIPMLHQASQAPLPSRTAGSSAAVVRAQMAEAMVKLGAESELNTIRAGAYSSVGEVRVLSITAMGAVDDQRMIRALQSFLEEPLIDVQLAAAGALARMGQTDGRPLAMQFAQLTEIAPEQSPVSEAQAAALTASLRAQAAWVLGWYKDADSLGQLGRMLSDTSPMVRVAAASSILKRTVERGQ